MKKPITRFIFAAISIICFTSCGPSEEEKKKAEQKADSIHNQIMKEIEKEVEEKKDTANIEKEK